MLYLARSSKEERMENCYNLFEKYNWDLTKFKNDTDLFIEEVKKNAREYIENVLKQPLTKEQVWCLMPTNVRLQINNYDKIIEQMLKENVIIHKQLLDIDWMTSNLRSYMCKFCYDVCEEYQWINEDIEQYCINSNILFISFKNLSRKYMVEILNYDEKQQEEHWNKKVKYRREHNLDNGKVSGKFATLFTELLRLEDSNEIINKLAEFNKGYFILYHEMMNFVTSYYNGDSEIKDQLLNKLKIYQEYLSGNRKSAQEEKREKRINDKLDNVRIIINEYISGEYQSVGEYCSFVNFDIKKFEGYIEFIKENDEELYNKYLKYQEGLKDKEYNELVSKCKKVVQLIKDGVIENGVKREFDLLDYYKYLPLGFDKMLREVRDYIDLDDYKILGNFVFKNKEKELSLNEIENLKSMRTIVGVQVDENKNVIPGTGREITIEEKQNIIDYLKLNNIPVTMKTYNLAYRKWLSGNIVIDEEIKNRTK